MKKAIKLTILICIISGMASKAQNELSSANLNPQFKSGNVLQNFNKPHNIYGHGFWSVNQPAEIIPLIDSAYYWHWDSGAKTWAYSNKVTDVIYNSKNLVTSYLNKEWRGGEWKNESLVNVTYNSGNLITTENTQTWNGTDWVNYTQTINTYNSNNLEISSIVQIWDGGNWVNQLQQTPVYNSVNLETSELIQTWNDNEWVNYSQTAYTYNSFNDPVSYLYQKWNDSIWVNSSQTTNTFDTYDNKTNSLGQLWNGITWTNFSQTTNFDVDSRGDVEGFAAQIWNGDIWENGGYVTNIYDANNVLESNIVKNFSSKGTITSGDSVYYYFNRTVSSAVDELTSNSTIKLYPNPANNTIHVVITLPQAAPIELRLINIQGQIVWSSGAENTSTYQNNISVANLPGGVYLFELVNGNNSSSQKVVIKH